MKTFWIAALLFLAAVSWPTPGQAEGWDWLKFGKKKEEKQKLTGSGAKQSYLGSSAKSRPVGATEKDDFFAIMRPKPDPKARNNRFTGSGTARQRAEEKPAFWKNWFASEEPKRPETVKEWMSQPRVQP